MKFQLLLVTVALSVLSTAAMSQTPLGGNKGDTPTGFSFANKQTVSSADQVYFDEAAVEESSPYTVQLSYTDREETARQAQSRLGQQYSDLFTNNPIKIKPKNEGFSVFVTSFEDKSLADGWCSNYKSVTKEDCIVLTKPDGRSDVRLAKLAEAIKMGMENPTRVTSRKIEPPLRQMPHQFQLAWEKADERTSGVFESAYCARCVYKMQVRELMVSNFELPRGEVITGFDIGDSSIFTAQSRGDNRLAIMAKTFGVDTNIQVYTEGGRVYPIYVRSLDVQSHLLPDLVLRIVDPTITFTEVKKPKTIIEAAELITAPSQVDTSNLLANLKPSGISDADFLKEIPFDPGKLRFDGFKVWGSVDKKLLPTRVFRDDKHIYIQYDNVNRLPGFVAHSVFDGIDERIGTRVSGNTFIIKGIADLVSLKSGNSYLCIELARVV